MSEPVAYSFNKGPCNYDYLTLVESIPLSIIIKALNNIHSPSEVNKKKNLLSSLCELSQSIYMSGKTTEQLSQGLHLQSRVCLVHHLIEISIDFSESETN